MLKEWYSDHDAALEDILEGNISVKNINMGGSLIHPRTWVDAVEHDDRIQFVPHCLYAVPAASETSSEDGEDDEEDDEAEEEVANYESRVEYVVEYYQRD